MNNHMGGELLFFLMDQNIMENGKKEKVMEVEQKLGKMVENILDNLKMINQTAKELLLILTAQAMLVNG